MASQSSTAWWTKDKQKGLQNRISAIQRLNDPTTNADELLSGSKVLLFLLLCFTGLLAAFSYYKNFAGSFPIPVALFMSIALTIAIEWGKNYCSTWAVRTPFFKGLGHIVATPANTFMFAGLVAIAIATFVMSVRNSTIGGRQLSVMLNQERNTTPFAADTRSIDTLIASAQGNISSASATKWRGTTTRESQRAITAQTKALESLNRQRETLIASQRADWEKQQAVQAENRNYAGSLVLTSGGWVELLQILLILVRVACEKALDGRLPYQEQEEKQGIGFRPGYRFAGESESPVACANRYNPDRRNSTEYPSRSGYAAPMRCAGKKQRRPIGFKRYEQQSEQPTVPPKITVEQCSTAFQPGTVATEQPRIHTVPATHESMLADVKEWQKRAQQCYTRARTQQRPEFRDDNFRRYTCYSIMLRAVGVDVQEGETLTFEHPTRYTINDQVTAVIVEQRERIARISRERRVGA